MKQRSFLAGFVIEATSTSTIKNTVKNTVKIKITIRSPANKSQGVNDGNDR